MKIPLVILPGAKYNRFTIVKEVEKYNGARYFECLCDCGNIKNVRLDSLTSGNEKSCGCYRKENTAKKSTTHGMTDSSLFTIWHSMKARCNNPKNDSYQWYGARGISVCELWLNDFKPFMEWAFANGYTEGLSIERENPNGNYEPGNCKWIPLKEQALNRKGTKWIEHNGVRKPMILWATDLKISYQLLRNRIYKGTSFIEAVKEMGGTI